MFFFRSKICCFTCLIPVVHLLSQPDALHLVLHFTRVTLMFVSFLSRSTIAHFTTVKISGVCIVLAPSIYAYAMFKNSNRGTQTVWRSHKLTAYTLWSTNLLTKWIRNLLSVHQLLQKSPTLYGNRWFITHSQQPATWPFHQPEQPSPWSRSPFLKMFLPSMSRSSKWSLSLRFHHQNPVYTSPFPRTCYTPRPSHYSRFVHPNNNWLAVQTITLLVM